MSTFLLLYLLGCRVSLSISQFRSIFIIIVSIRRQHEYGHAVRTKNSRFVRRRYTGAFFARVPCSTYSPKFWRIFTFHCRFAKKTHVTHNIGTATNALLLFL